MEIVFLKVIICLCICLVLSIIAGYYVIVLPKNGYLFLPIIFFIMINFSFVCITGFIMGDLIWI